MVSILISTLGDIYSICPLNRFHAANVETGKCVLLCLCWGISTKVYILGIVSTHVYRYINFAVFDYRAEITQQDLEFFHFYRVLHRSRRSRTKPGNSAKCAQGQTVFQKFPAVHKGAFPDPVNLFVS